MVKQNISKFGQIYMAGDIFNFAIVSIFLKEIFSSFDAIESYSKLFPVQEFVVVVTICIWINLLLFQITKICASCSDENRNDKQFIYLKNISYIFFLSSLGVIWYEFKKLNGFLIQSNRNLPKSLELGFLGQYEVDRFFIAYILAVITLIILGIIWHKAESEIKNIIIKYLCHGPGEN